MDVEAATATAARLARRYGEDYYVLRRRGASVVFWWDGGSLPRLLRAGDGGLVALRVAHPDGTVEALDAPGTVPAAPVHGARRSPARS